MNFSDCSQLNAREREELFGKGFTEVAVTGFCVEDGVMFTRIKVNGNALVLIGDPEKALDNYLLGGGKLESAKQ